MNEVEIILKAVDRASGEINKVATAGGKLSAGFKSLTGVSLGAAGAMAIIGGAVTKLVAYTKDAIAKNDAYVTSIVDMSRVLGLTTVETSKLVQASDDLFLSQSTLNTAMLAASRQGVDTSIEGLQKLSGEYLQLNPGVERAQFLMQRFGRSGADMGKLMELGADGIREAMDATSKSLIVTKQSEITAYDYKRSLDAVNDALDGMAYAVSQGTMPAMTDFNLKMAEFVDTVNDSGIVTKVLNKALDIATKALMFWDGVLSNDLSKWIIVNDHVKTFGKNLRELPDAIDAVATADFNLVSSFTSIENDYMTAVEENNAEMLELFEERARLRKLGYSNESKAIKDIDTALDANAQKASDNAAAHEDATNRIIFSYITQQLAIDGLDERETAFLLEKGVEWGIYSEDAIEKMQAVRDEWENFKPEDKSATFTAYYFSQGSYGSGSYSSDGAYEQGQAGGGLGGGMTLVGERGPEVVDLPAGSRVHNHLESQGGGGMSQSDMAQMARLFAIESATALQKILVQ